MNPSQKAIFTDPHKLTSAYGEKKATSLYQVYLKLAPTLEWANKDTLDIGCHWGYLQKMLVDQAKVNSAYGVDITPRWEAMGADNPSTHEKIHLLWGDVRKIPMLQAMHFHIILSSSTLMTFSIPVLEETTTWMWDHLHPDGMALIRIRSFLSYNGGDFYGQFNQNLPYAHLLFGKPAIQEAMGQAPRFMVPYSPATWALHFFRHGFEVLNMIQASQNPFPDIRARHSQKLENYCQKELAPNEISLWLRKPAAPSNLEEFLVRAPS
jgi:hypothetical protein